MSASLLLVTALALVPADFQPHVDYPAGRFPFGITVADVTGDGLPDVLSANTISRDLSLRPGAGDGTLGAGTVLDPGGDPRAIGVTDLDDDGDADLVVGLRMGPGSIAVLLNEDGVFAPPVFYGTTGGGFSLEIVDLDLDGDDDVAVCFALVGESFAEVLLNDGAGVFTVAGTHLADETDIIYIADLSVGDVDGDDLPDLAVCTLNSGHVSLLRNTGGGSFAPAVLLDLGPLIPSAVLLRDFTGDGAVDLAVVSNCVFGGDDRIVTAVNDGAGGFTVAGTFDLGDACHPFTTPTGVEAFDADLDGLLDLVVSARTGHQVVVLSGRGDGTFDPFVAFGTDEEPMGLGVGDLDGDGRTDVVTGNLGAGFQNDTFSVLLNAAFAPADVNEDGLVGVDDLVAVIAAWGVCPPVCPADVNGSGGVGVDDLVAVISNWSPGG